MRATTEEYYSDGIKQAKELFDRLYPRRNHGVHLGLDSSAIRARLDSDKVPSDTLFQASLADLWLHLPQKVGIDRRKVSPPPSPFKKIPGKGNAGWAAKAQVIQWDAAWRLKDGVSELTKRLESSGSSEVSSSAGTLRKKLLWIVEHGDVLGWIEDLPATLFEQAKIEDLAIKSWTIEQALHRPWRDRVEQDLWVERYAAGHRLLEAEVERLALEHRARKARGVSNSDGHATREL